MFQQPNVTLIEDPQTMFQQQEARRMQQQQRLDFLSQMPAGAQGTVASGQLQVLMSGHPGQGQGQGQGQGLPFQAPPQPPSLSPQSMRGNTGISMLQQQQQQQQQQREQHMNALKRRSFDTTPSNPNPNPNQNQNHALGSGSGNYSLNSMNSKSPSFTSQQAPPIPPPPTTSSVNPTPLPLPPPRVLGRPGAFAPLGQSSNTGTALAMQRGLNIQQLGGDSGGRSATEVARGRIGGVGVGSSGVAAGAGGGSNLSSIGATVISAGKSFWDNVYELFTFSFDVNKAFTLSVSKIKGTYLRMRHQSIYNPQFLVYFDIF
jgi:hypothetical protein